MSVFRERETSRSWGAACGFTALSLANPVSA